MKKLTIGLSVLASTALVVVVAFAQQTGGGTAGTPSTTGGASAAGQSRFSQPGAPREQAGQRLAPQQPGIETRQNVMTPSNRFGQQRGFNIQRGAADPLPTPAERQAQGLDAGRGVSGQSGQMGPTVAGQRGAAQRGELGVWLAANGGPGVVIRQVTEGSAAAEIGLRPGDVLLQVNGRGVESPIEVQQMIRAIPAGETVVLEVWRGGSPQEVSVTLQPIREPYRSGYRGGETPAPRGDLESRTMRLEEQLSMVMRELQQIRADIVRLHPESSLRQAGGEVGMEQPARQSQPSPFDRIGTTQPGPAEEEPAATQSDPFAEEPSAEEPAASEPSATEPQPAATEPAATEPAEPATEPTEDLFGGEAAEPEPEAETPAESETEKKTDTESDTDLFQ